MMEKVKEKLAELTMIMLESKVFDNADCNMG